MQTLELGSWPGLTYARQVDEGDREDPSWTSALLAPYAVDNSDNTEFTLLWAGDVQSSLVPLARAFHEDTIVVPPGSLLVLKYKFLKLSETLQMNSHVLINPFPCKRAGRPVLERMSPSGNGTRVSLALISGSVNAFPGGALGFADSPQFPHLKGTKHR